MLRFLILFLTGSFLSSGVLADVAYLPAKAAWASEIRSLRDAPHLLIYGEISAADADAMRSLIAQLQKAKPAQATPIVFLNSPGGDVLAAMRMGAMLREARAMVTVDNQDSCSSACIFVFAGGVERNAFPGSRLGLHRPAFDPALFANLSALEAEKRYNELIARSRDYFRSFGVDEKLFSDMLRVPSQKVGWVDTDYARVVNLHGTDPAHEEWTRARMLQRHGPEYVRQSDLRLNCPNSGTNPRTCAERFPVPGVIGDGIIGR